MPKAEADPGCTSRKFPTAGVSMNDESITWGVTLRVYWLIAWRTLAMYFLTYGAFALWLMVTDRVDDGSYFFVRFALAFLLLSAASFVALRMALRKRYRGFKIQITREPVS
jgi:hypothetical protein